MSKKRLSTAILLVQFAIFAVLIWASVASWRLYSYFQQYPQKEFTSERYYFNGTAFVNKGPEIAAKVARINACRLPLLIGAGLLILFFIMEYYERKERSWLSALVEFIRKFIKRFEEVQP